MRRFLGALCEMHNLSSCTSVHCTHCPPGSIHSGFRVCLVLECAKLILAFRPLPLPLPLPSISSFRASHLAQLDSLLFWAQITSDITSERFLHQPQGFPPPLHLQVTLLHPCAGHWPLPESSFLLYGLCSINSPPGGKIQERVGRSVLKGTD